MRAFEVHLNGEKVCVAGIGDHGVLNAMVDHVISGIGNELHFRVGGLISETDEHVTWVNQKLKVGDEVQVKVIEAAEIDEPQERSHGNY